VQLLLGAHETGKKGGGVSNGELLNIGSAKESFLASVLFSWGFLQQYYVLICAVKSSCWKNVLVIRELEGSKKHKRVSFNAVSDAIDRRSRAVRKAGAVRHSIRSLHRIALALLGLLQSPHGAVQRMSVVSPELGVGTLERRVSVRLRLLDTVLVVLLSLVVLGRVL